MAPLAFTASLSDVQLAKFIQVMTFLLIPVLLVLALLFYKTIQLLQHAIDFINIARFDLIPMVQDARTITNHVAKLSTQVDESSQKIRNTAEKVGPMLESAKASCKTGAGKIKQAVMDGISAMLKPRHTQQ